MGKDFQAFLEDEKNRSDYIPPQKSYDPNYLPNKEQSDEIYQYNKTYFFINASGQAMLALLTAPLTTIYTSLQLSVLPHKNKYGDAAPEEQLKALVKTSTEITPIEKRKYELMIKSGVTGSNRPFRAPVYSGYIDVVRGLSGQGLLGFYKGYQNILTKIKQNFRLLTGLEHTIFNSYFRFVALSRFDFEYNKFWHQVFSTSTIVDFLLNPLMMCQSRFILQNRLPNFFLYKSQSHFYQKHNILSPHEFYKGASGHIYKNIFLLLATLPTFLIPNEEKKMKTSSFISLVVGYPWLTVIRRLQCQSKLPGMIPIRYAGSWHCFILMIREEGIRGLYRGFGAYAFANGFISYLMFFGLNNNSVLF